MSDTSSSTSSVATCWFCESNTALDSKATDVKLVKLGEQDKTIHIPRCALCAKVHDQGAGIAIGFIGGLILGLIVWWKVGFLLALLTLVICTAVGGLLEWLLVGRKLKEKSVGLTIKPVEDAMDHPEVQKLLDLGWQTKKEAKREKNDFFKAIKRYELAEIVKMLDKNPKLIDEKETGKDGYTPIIYACSLEPMVSAVYSKKDPLGVIKLLVKRGADLTCRDHLGGTLLHKACSERFFEAAEYLINNHGFNPNIRNNEGQTPLHRATHEMFTHPDFTTEKHPQLIEFLVSKGADINAQDRLGQTPLMLAIPRGLLNWGPTVLSSVKMQLALGADVNVRDEKGKTAYEMLLECEKDDDYADVLALFEGGKRIGICEVCGNLVFAEEPFYENREWGSTPMSSGTLHYDIGRGIYHESCAKKAGYV